MENLGVSLASMRLGLLWGAPTLPQASLGGEVSSNLCCSKQKEPTANIFGQSSSLPDLCLLLILPPRNFSATHVTNCKAHQGNTQGGKSFLIPF